MLQPQPRTSHVLTTTPLPVCCCSGLPCKCRHVSPRAPPPPLPGRPAGVALSQGHLPLALPQHPDGHRWNAAPCCSYACPCQQCRVGLGLSLPLTPAAQCLRTGPSNSWPSSPLHVSELRRSLSNLFCASNCRYNTLIDVYGKSGQWEAALGVLEQMKREVRGALHCAVLRSAAICVGLC